MSIFTIQDRRSIARGQHWFDLFDVLSKDDDVSVRLTLARNEKVPTKILHVLSTDVDYSVRLAVACNPNTSMESLKLMRENEMFWDIRKYAIKNHSDRGGSPVLCKHIPGQERGRRVW